METQALTKRILDKALELEHGDQLYVNCSTLIERDLLFSDLIRRRIFLIMDQKLAQYESVIISDKGGGNTITLSKVNIESAQIRKLDTTRMDVQL